MIRILLKRKNLKTNLLILSYLIFVNQNLSGTEINYFNFSDLNASGLQPNTNSGFTIPVVRLYNKQGKLSKQLFGKDIYNLKSYPIMMNITKNIASNTLSNFTTPVDLNKILLFLNIKRKSNKPTLLYIDFKDLCPPSTCLGIRKKFSENISTEISKKYEIIFLSGIDK